MKNNKDNYESFEIAFEELKQIVQNFEKTEDISLEDLLKNYEQGMIAYSYCMKKLEDTQRKIKIIDSNFE